MRPDGVAAAAARRRGIAEGLVVMAGGGYVLSQGFALHHRSGADRALRGWALSPGLFPVIVGSSLLVLGFLLLAGAVRTKAAKAGVQGDPAANWSGLLLALFVSVLYCLLLPRLHFVAATALFAFGLSLVYGEAKWWAGLLLSVLAAFLAYAAFGLLLGVRLP